MFSLSKKVAVVTGGGSGIGQAICQRFAASGAIVYVLDVNLTAARETAAAITADGSQVFTETVDVAIQKDVRATFRHIHEQAGRIDILINNAGIAHIGNVEETTESDFERIFQVNVKGIYNCAREAVSIMKQQDGGVIINLASIAGSLGIPDRFAYSMSKGAVLSMTYSLARDYLQDNIRCNSISPARVHTPFVDGYLANNYPDKIEEMFATLSKTQPIGRMGKPAEIAALCHYLCSDEAAFITGTDYPIDGGFIRLNT